MRVGLFGDIHGNLVAFDAVLAALEAERADRLVCLGDVAPLGPEPIPVLERLESLDCPVVRGNVDDWLLKRPDDILARQRNTILIDRLDWTLAQLSDDHLAFLQSFVPTVELDLGSGVRLNCFHATPRSNDERIGAWTPDDELLAAFDGSTATLQAGGHTHEQLLRRIRGQWLINPGSVGMTFCQTATDDETKSPPWAEYGIVAVSNGSIEVSLRAVPLDLDAVIASARRARMPHAEWWIEGWTKNTGWQ
jgi:predicted phosphodiesterase